MSVLIKGMKKPKTCYSIIDGEAKFCPFVNTDDDCVLLLGGECYGTWEEQYADCPLGELPEKHGRLIDESIVLENIRKSMGIADLSFLYNAEKSVVNEIYHAPTVIEAEGK